MKKLLNKLTSQDFILTSAIILILVAVSLFFIIPIYNSLLDKPKDYIPIWAIISCLAIGIFGLILTLLSAINCRK